MLELRRHVLFIVGMHQTVSILVLNIFLCKFVPRSLCCKPYAINTMKEVASPQSSLFQHFNLEIELLIVKLYPGLDTA